MATIGYNEAEKAFILNTTIPGSERVKIDISKSEGDYIDPSENKKLTESIKSQVIYLEAQKKTVKPESIISLIQNTILRSIPTTTFNESVLNNSLVSLYDGSDPELSSSSTNHLGSNSLNLITGKINEQMNGTIDANNTDAFIELKNAQKEAKKRSGIYQETVGGHDMSVFFISEVPVLADVLDGIPTKDCRKELIVLEMDNVLSIQYSTIREVFPVRVLGEINPISFTRGPRTIAGSIAFAIFSEDVLTRLRSRVLEEFQRLFSGIKQTSSDDSDTLKIYRYYDAALQFNNVQLLDSLPPFHLLVMGINENGIMSKFIIKNIRIIDENQTQGTRFPNTINKATFVACDIIPMYMSEMEDAMLDSMGSNGEKNIVSSMKSLSASDVLKQEVEGNL